jgi:hypothetical protein
MTNLGDNLVHSNLTYKGEKRPRYGRDNVFQAPDNSASWEHEEARKVLNPMS